MLHKGYGTLSSLCNDISGLVNQTSDKQTYCGGPGRTDTSGKLTNELARMVLLEHEAELVQGVGVKPSGRVAADAEPRRTTEAKHLNQAIDFETISPCCTKMDGAAVYLADDCGSMTPSPQISVTNRQADSGIYCSRQKQRLSTSVLKAVADAMVDATW